MFLLFIHHEQELLDHSDFSFYLLRLLILRSLLTTYSHTFSVFLSVRTLPSRHRFSFISYAPSSDGLLVGSLYKVFLPYLHGSSLHTLCTNPGKVDRVMTSVPRSFRPQSLHRSVDHSDLSLYPQSSIRFLNQSNTTVIPRKPKHLTSLYV